MLENVKKIWQRFIYRDSILLEAERQKTAFGYMEDWAEKLSQLKEDDVFATLIQVYNLVSEKLLLAPIIPNQPLLQLAFVLPTYTTK